jgi:hypothetical protein
MIEDIIKKVLKEVTSSGGSRGSYIAPLLPGERYFKPNVLAPFTVADSKYKSPDLSYDSYDGKMERSKKQIDKEEKIAKKI